MIELYRWKIYDISKDEYVESSRYGTKEAIGRARGVMIEQVWVDNAVQATLQDGLTEKGFNPTDHQTTRTETGFQKQVY